MVLFAWLASLPASAEDAGRTLPPVVENSLGMKFVLIPSGTSLMGSDERPEALAAAYPQYERRRLVRLGDEAPVHRVRITRAFYLGQHEVTVGQFRRFVEASGYVPEAETDGTGGYGYNASYDPATSARGDAFDGRHPKYSWRNPGFPQSDDHPVVNVTWNDAVAMSEWLSAKEGKKYRLPTEAEWEYACRAGTRTRYHGGDDPQTLTAVANTFDVDSMQHWPRWQAFALAGHDGFEFTAPVGSFAPNAFHLHDMHGNVWEWVADWYDENYYARAPTDDPQGPATGNVRVRRGGSWHTWALYARCAFRNWNTPASRYTLLGMRLVREADESGRSARAASPGRRHSADFGRRAPNVKSVTNARRSPPQNRVSRLRRMLSTLIDSSPRLRIGPDRVVVRPRMRGAYSHGGPDEETTNECQSHESTDARFAGRRCPARCGGRRHHGLFARRDIARRHRDAGNGRAPGGAGSPQLGQTRL